MVGFNLLVGVSKDCLFSSLTMLPICRRLSLRPLVVTICKEWVKLSTKLSSARTMKNRNKATCIPVLGCCHEGFVELLIAPNQKSGLNCTVLTCSDSI